MYRELSEAWKVSVNSHLRSLHPSGERDMSDAEPAITDQLPISDGDVTFSDARRHSRRLFIHENLGRARLSIHKDRCVHVDNPKVDLGVSLGGLLEGINCFVQRRDVSLYDIADFCSEGLCFVSGED